LSPNHSYVLFYVAGTYLAELRVNEAHTLVERLGQVDPNFPDLGWLLWMSGDLDGAWTHARGRLEWNPADIRAREGMVTLETMRGNVAEAIVHLRILNEMLAAEGIDRPLFYGSGYVYNYGRLGLADEARQAFEEVLKDRDVQYPASWIYHYLGIGDIDSALEVAEQLAERPLPPWVEIDHYFVLNVTRDPVLDRPEFVELRRKLGFRGD
jgi:tetratricopeptide (TPR) repeat protein